MTSVFIGSTGRDLVEYRRAAIDTCNKLGLLPIAMEHFVAMGVGAVAGSKRKLDDADLYVGIYAHRYGYIERPAHDKSVTEIEFDYAGERGLDRLCFLIDPNYSWPRASMDLENDSRLQAFKGRIDHSLIRARFTTVDDFVAKLVLALVGWLSRPSRMPILPPTTIPVSAPTPAIAESNSGSFVGRENDVTRLKARLGISPNGHDHGRMQQFTIIRGWPGVGKTTLLAEIGKDAEVKNAFPDGVLSAHLGDPANPLSELAAWHRTLHPTAVTPPHALDQAMRQLGALLADRRMLLIVDDVWRRDDAIPFKIGGPRCATLFTTRLPGVASDLARMPDEVFVLNVLSDDVSLTLFSLLAPTVVKRFPEQSAQLVRDLEGLPLAIRVAGRLLHDEARLRRDVTPFFAELRESRLLQADAPDDRFDPKTGTTPTIKLLLSKSTDGLNQVIHGRFALLGYLAPKPAVFDLEDMCGIWDVSDALPTVRMLVARGLVEPMSTAGEFQMHALLVMHARSLLQE